MSKKIITSLSLVGQIHTSIPAVPKSGQELDAVARGGPPLLLGRSRADTEAR